MRNNYHSFLFVPATERMLSKIEGCKADAVIVDLEDAIPEADKFQALKRLENFLEQYSFGTDIFVRINPQRASEEAAVLNSFDIMGYMLPKTESAKDVEEFKKLAGAKKIIALIESAMGIVNAQDIIRCEFTDTAAFGAEDYTTQCGIENKSEYLSYPKSRLVALSKAYGKRVIDTISLNIRDEAAYTVEAQSSKSFGFDGKLAIHPMQAAVINRVFSDDTEYMKYIVNEYEKSGAGVLNMNGKVFEKPHIDAMRRKIEESENGKN